VVPQRCPFCYRFEVDKQRERSTIEAFLLFQDYPISSLVQWDRERPDGLVRLGEETIGIEVTTVVEATPRQTVPPQKWEAEARRAVRAAQASFEKRHSRALVVRIDFRPDWRPNKRKATELGDELATMVEERTPSELLASDARFKHVQFRDPHPDVSWLFIGYTRQSLGGHWAPALGGQNQYATADDIQETVRRKEARIEIYRRAAAIVWLLIDCDLTGQGIALDVSHPIDFTVRSGFDRVFSCGFGKWRWVEIPCIND